MNLLFFYKYINLTLFAVLGNFRPTSSAAFSFRNPISLYNATDKIAVFTSENFSSTVYQSDTAWLIEFYAGWCGHCQTYANTYREISIDIWAWRTVVRIGSINCPDGENRPICRQHNVRGFPVLQLIPPDTVFDNQSNMTTITIAATDAKPVEQELIKGLENLRKGNRTWPRFTPVNRITLEELCTRIPKSIKLLLVIVEQRDDFTGRQIMLDFSKYHNQISIFRTTPEGQLWRELHLNNTDLPALFLIHRNQTAVRLDTKSNNTTTTGKRNVFNYAIRSYIHQTKVLDNFDNDDLKEIIHNKEVLKNAKRKQEFNQINNQNLTDDKDTVYQKVNMIDLEMALSYMFRQEIPQIEDIQGEAYQALSQWLNVLTKYFPGREPVMAYLKHVLVKVDGHPEGLNGNKFREIIDTKTSNAFLPNNHEQYQHCAGSAPQYRGYPCALWLLFHTLTVSQYKKATSNSSPVNIIEIPMAIKDYVKYFFACRKCSENFMQETADINRLNLTNQYEAILYLWKTHNHVNQRLRNDITEDPEHPKVQFPSKYLCTTCQLKTTNEYDQSKTVDFLLKYYSKENIETSLLRKESFRNESERIISRIDYINQSGFFSRFSDQFSIFIFVVLLILILLIRRRYCKTKRKRYTI